MEWEKWFTYKKTIAVDSVVSSDHFRHSRFVSQKVKDAIADRFRAKFSLRPSVDLKEPDVRIHIHIVDDRCSVSLDSSGDSLHKRGYRRSSWMAPLNEVLAAGMILISGWSREMPFMDLMCGSGTLLIEAAMIGKSLPPGIFRNKYCFRNWLDYDDNLFEKVRQDLKPRKDHKLTIEGFDISREALSAAVGNIKQAGLRNDITVRRSPFQEISNSYPSGVIITNPPYGERLEDEDVKRLHIELGDKLKKDFAGFQAWILSGNMEAIKQIGLRTSRKLTLFNGAIQCKFHRYDLYKGSKKENG
jgi:putative N6-adenine-specific DNA methylase